MKIPNIFKQKAVQYAICMIMLLTALFLPYAERIAVIQNLQGNDTSTKEQLSNIEAQDQEIVDYMFEKIDEITMMDIFGNNLFIAILTLSPVMGVPFGLKIMANTGRVLVALQPSWQLLLFNPILWIEMTAYAYALLQGIYIMFYLAKNQLRVAIFVAKDAIFSITILLFFSAIFEILLIQSVI